MKTTSTLSAAALGMMACLQAASFSYDFDVSQADFNANFNATDSGEWSTAGIPGWNSTGGVDNSGRIQSGGNNNTAVLLTASDFSTVGSSNTVSAWFEARVNGSGEINGFNALGVGFTTDTSGTLNGNQYFAADVVAGGTSGTNVLNVRRRESGTLNASDTDEFSFTDGNWYKLENVVTKEAGVGNFSFVVTLTDYGVGGTGTGTVVDTFSTGILGGMTTLWNQTELNAAFQGYSQGGAGGARGFDNFEATVIPEPGTLALVGLTALAMMLIQRRKR